jgi:WD40 repeat protein
VTFSPDGQQLASTSNDRTLRLWNAATGAHLRTLEGHTDSINSVTFSPDGQQLASASNDRTVRLWDAATGAHLRTLEGHTGWVNSVTFSPDGQQLASTSDDRTLRLWDAATGICLQALEGRMKSIAFSPDGSNLVTDCGVLSVRQTPQSNHAPKWIGYCIGIENKWITWNGNNVLWLPSEYRRSAFAAEKDRIGIGCISGVVHILNFCPGILPH